MTIVVDLGRKARKQTNKQTNAHTDLFSESRSLNFPLNLHLRPNFAFASSEGSGESVYMCRLFAL